MCHIEINLRQDRHSGVLNAITSLYFCLAALCFTYVPGVFMIIP